MDRITHCNIATAVARYNEARGLSYPSVGYLQYADIRGDGSNRRGLYVIVNEGGGVGTSYVPRLGSTMRETLRNVEAATACHMGVPWYKNPHASGSRDAYLWDKGHETMRKAKGQSR